MTSAELKKRSFDSVKEEITSIEKAMTAEADKGQLKVLVDSATDAARAYFTQQGFKVKIFLEPGKEIGTSNKILFAWD